MKNIVTTISMTAKNQFTMPKVFVDAVGFHPGQYRAALIGNGIYLTPIPEPTEAEFRRVLKLADTGKHFGKKEAKMLDNIIKKDRAKNKSRH